MKILQFGTGRFLRGFFAPIVEDPKSITVVQSRRNSSGADEINSQPNGFHVWTRGIRDGQTIDEFEKIESIGRAIVAHDDWKTLRQIATDSDLKLLVSNTTAAGLCLDESDDEIDIETSCPESFPAKVVSILWDRFRNGLPGLTILPLELVENNASTLRDLVVKQAERWPRICSEGFLAWIRNNNRWLNNLVDRIVVLPTEKPPWSDEDRLAVATEPFRMLAIEGERESSDVIPHDEMVIWTKSLDRFFLRKVRILNGLHTAMVAKFLPQGFETVLQCVTDESARRWLDELLEQEILPVLDEQGYPEPDFAKAVMERFENPFFQHRLQDIALGHETKLDVRIRSTFDEFKQFFQRTPAKLESVLQADLPSAVSP